MKFSPPAVARALSPCWLGRPAMTCIINDIRVIFTVTSINKGELCNTLVGITLPRWGEAISGNLKKGNRCVCARAHACVCKGGRRGGGGQSRFDPHCTWRWEWERLLCSTWLWCSSFLTAELGNHLPLLALPLRPRRWWWRRRRRRRRRWARACVIVVREWRCQAPFGCGISAAAVFHSTPFLSLAIHSFWCFLISCAFFGAGFCSHTTVHSFFLYIPLLSFSLQLDRCSESAGLNSRDLLLSR